MRIFSTTFAKHLMKRAKVKRDELDRQIPLADSRAANAGGGIERTGTIGRHGVPSEGSPRRQPWVSCEKHIKPQRGERIMAHTFTNLLTHIIYSTKDRMPTLEPDLKQRLFPYMGGILR